MTREKEDIPASGRKWALIGGAAVLVVVAVVCLMILIGGETGPDEPNPSAAMQRAYKQLSRRVAELMTDAEFVEASGAIESFLKQYPDTPQGARLWALKIACHRKSNDLSGALLSVADLAAKYQGRGEDLCDAGDVLSGRECFQDAAKAYELASDDESVRARACYHAAICNYRLGRFGAAMKYIDVVAAIKPDDPKVAAAVKRIEDARFAMD